MPVMSAQVYKEFSQFQPENRPTWKKTIQTTSRLPMQQVELRQHSVTIMKISTFDSLILVTLLYTGGIKELD